MSHEFETGFFVRLPAWHRLGTVLKESPTIKQALILSGLNWRVLENPVYQHKNGQKLILSKELIRDIDSRVLGVVKPEYVPLQNQNVFDWFEPLLRKGDIELEAAGSLQDGQRIWILAKLKNNEAQILKEDWVRPYLLLHNSHDGSTAAWIQFTPIRVVCKNTLNGAVNNRFGDLLKKKALSLPHTLEISEQLERIRNLVDLTKQEFKISVEEYRSMSNQEITEELLTTYFGSVLGTSQPTSHPAWSQLIVNFETGVGNKGKTLWDAYNAITEWIDYQQEKSLESLLYSSWFGAGARIRYNAHKNALKILSQSSSINNFSEISFFSHTKSLSEK